MKKVLFVATITAHINGFHTPYLKWFKNQGYEVDVASNGREKIEYCDNHFNLPFTRSPFSIKNFKAYKKLKDIINKNNYEIIHCHTPVGSVLTRLAVKNSKKKVTKVIYTAHGFHFFKGAPILNWLIYYPIEKYLSKYTDILITINNEDYNLAKKKLKAKEVELVYGVGVDENKFEFELKEEEKKYYRKQLNLKSDDFIFISIGELVKNKNQIMQIKAMKDIVEKNKKVKLLIVGEGYLRKTYENKIKKYNLEDNVYLIGYRKDIPKLLKMSNCLLATSKREGLPVNVMEAMFCKLPIIVTNSRGQRDLVNEGNIIEMSDVNGLIEKMQSMIKHEEKIKYNLDSIKLNAIVEKMEEIYKKGFK